MTFRVEPSVLDGYAGQIDRAADDSDAVKRYLSRYPAPGGFLDGGVNALIGAVGAAQLSSMATATATIGRLTTVLESSRIGLVEAARYYRHTDADAAARLDATVLGRCPSGDTAMERQWAGNPCAPSFWDSRDPSARLKPADDVDYTHPLAFMDYLSVSDWALKGFDAVFGFNPLEKITEVFLGDWQAVAKGGVALGRAADALPDIAYNVQGGAIAVRQGWEGLAAESAYERFTRTATMTADLADPLRQISEKFAEISHGVWSTTEALNGFIKGLLDAAIIAGIAAAAGTITAASGVGAIVGYGVAAIEVANMLRLWAQATAAISAIYGLVQAAVGVIEGQLSRLDAAALPDLSGAPGYRHPLVPQTVGPR
jgi:hypothetical protein